MSNNLKKKRFQFCDVAPKDNFSIILFDLLRMSCLFIFQSYQCSDPKNDSYSGAACEGYKYFSRLEVSLRSLFVLLTTANNPDGKNDLFNKDIRIP